MAIYFVKTKREYSLRRLLLKAFQMGCCAHGSKSMEQFLSWRDKVAPTPQKFTTRLAEGIRERCR